jgi:hypothetical protein
MGSPTLKEQLPVYTFSLQNNFPNDDINCDLLTAQIQASSLATPLDHIDVSGDVVLIWFVSSLSAGDQTTLDS